MTFLKGHAVTQIPPPVLTFASTPEGLREIAQRQRAIILCILGALVIYAGLVVGVRTLPLIAILGLYFAYLAIVVTATVFVFLLTTKLYGTGIGVLLGVLTLIPCVGLITLLIVNGKATAILKANGVKVGLLGGKVGR